MPSPPREPSENLTRQTFAGLKWSYLQTAVGVVFQLVSAVVLARILGPEVFGLMALADLALRFVSYVARAGVTQAIIQKPDLRSVDVRAGMTASIALGIVFFLVTWVLAPLAAALFTEPDIVPVLRWLGLSLTLYGVGATADALLRRQMRFRTLAVRDISASVVALPLAIVLALLGMGVWSLVVATLVETTLRSVLAYAAVRHSVVPTFDRRAHGAVLSFGGRVSLISFFEFLGSELDTLAVGRFAGTVPLGLYNRAYILTRLPVYQVTTSLSKVLFPAFSSVQSDLRRFRGAYVSTLSVITAIVFPVTAGMAVAGAEIVAVLLGPQWLGAVPVLPWVAAAAALEMSTHVPAITMEARAHLNAKVAIVVSKTVLLALLLLVAAGGPLWGYGAALAAAALYDQVAYLAVVPRSLGLSWAEQWPTFRNALAAAALLAAGIAAIRSAALAAGGPLPVVLAAEVAAGAIGLYVQLRFGLLTPVRDEIVMRLGHAGLVSPDGAGWRGWVARALVGTPTSR